jgi:hypothetical protein
MEPGFRSRVFWIPSAGVGGVVLVNGPESAVPRAIVRKTLEVLFDGHREAEEDAASSLASDRTAEAQERRRLSVPPDPDVVATLAKHYANAALGRLEIISDGPAPVVDTGGWKCTFATRKNDDGTTSLVLLDAFWSALVVGTHAGKRSLTLRDGQHEYVFVETA